MLMGFIGAFQFFSGAWVMTRGGPGNATLTIVIYLYRKAFEQLRFGYASPVAWLLFCIIMACTLILVKTSDRWVYYAGEIKA